MKNQLFTFLLSLFFSHAVAQNLPYQNPNLSAQERARDLCSRLTLEEKAQLMLDESPAIPRLGIKKFFWWSEALHGAANMGNVTVFPEPVALAASSVAEPWQSEGSVLRSWSATPSPAAVCRAIAEGASPSTPACIM
jgi:beta-glucosidase-like glycosyl hydrolase